MVRLAEAGDRVADQPHARPPDGGLLAFVRLLVAPTHRGGVLDVVVDIGTPQTTAVVAGRAAHHRFTILHSTPSTSWLNKHMERCGVIPSRATLRGGSFRVMPVAIAPFDRVRREGKAGVTWVTWANAVHHHGGTPVGRRFKDAGVGHYGVRRHYALPRSTTHVSVRGHGVTTRTGSMVSASELIVAVTDLHDEPRKVLAPCCVAGWKLLHLIAVSPSSRWRPVQSGCAAAACHRRRGMDQTGAGSPCRHPREARGLATSAVASGSVGYSQHRRSSTTHHRWSIRRQAGDARGPTRLEPTSATRLAPRRGGSPVFRIGPSGQQVPPPRRYAAVMPTVDWCPVCPYREFGEAIGTRGDATSRIVLVGEAPGTNEIDKGLPFVGRAGRRCYGRPSPRSDCTSGTSSSSTRWPAVRVTRSSRSAHHRPMAIDACHERLAMTVGCIPAQSSSPSVRPPFRPSPGCGASRSRRRSRARNSRATGGPSCRRSTPPMSSVAGWLGRSTRCSSRTSSMPGVVPSGRSERSSEAAAQGPSSGCGSRSPRSCTGRLATPTPTTPRSRPLGTALGERGWYTRDEFLTVARWKSPRSRRALRGERRGRT